ncbi:MAG: YlbF family regulator [Clostridia bacterium]|nr:YlbF family regulator [Clostridia bacterium]
MDTILQMAIDLAYQLQQDERCQAVLTAQQNADADENLQQLIGEFNMKRMAINTEESKDESERNVDKLRELNTELRAIYASVMANEHMMAYNQAKTALDEIVGKIQIAINLAVQGRDPQMAAEQSSCTGDCGSCGGCH